MRASHGASADLIERGSTMAWSNPWARRARAWARRSPRPSRPWRKSAGRDRSTSGMRASRGSVHAGAMTPMKRSGRAAFKAMNRLCAMTMSPTHEGPTTSTRPAAVTACRRGREGSAVLEDVVGAAVGAQGVTLLLDGDVYPWVRVPQAHAVHGTVERQVGAGDLHAQRRVGRLQAVVGGIG